MKSKRGLGSIRKLSSGRYQVRYTDPNGFPIMIDTPFKFASNHLSDPTIIDADLTPANIWITSQYAIHDLMGISYITISFNKLFVT